MTQGDDSTRPLLRLIKGNATEEEVAALVTVLAALSTTGGTEHKRPPSEWSARHRKVRVSLPHGPGGWRSSGLPS